MSVENERADVDRLDENVNGLYNLVSSLRGRLEELEDENAELRAELEMLKQEVGQQ